MNNFYLREVRIKPGVSTRPCLRNLFPITFSHRITIVIGENGCGKSTLLEGIAVKLGCNPEGGGKNFIFKTEDTHSDLHQKLILSKGHIKEKDLFFYRAETFYNLNTEIRRLDEERSFGPEIKTYYGGQDLHTISHGEAMEKLFQCRFNNKGLYILDEPEASLSPQRQLAFILRIFELANQGAQFIIATHSPIIMSMPGCELLEIADGTLNKIQPTETSAYSIYKSVLNSSGDFLRKLVFAKEDN
ncbi:MULTISPECIES: AAA family ATPase [unclassified Pseudomonas]|uniref:AAA family ATPase n=1 Tax=unclassified Pseudomonas TaxID=196821 RepID=UPI0030DC8019